MITVRPATPEDNEAIREVIASAVATLRETYRPSAGTVARKAAILGQLHRLVGVINGRVVGTTQYWIDGDAVRIVGLGVHSQFRRMGVATELVRCVAEIGDGLGAKRLVLHTVRQTGNVPVFEKLGFEVVSETEDQHSESSTYLTLVDVEMHKPLKAFSAPATEHSE